MLAQAAAKRGVPALTGETLATVMGIGAVLLLVNEVYRAGDVERGVLSALPGFLSLLTLALGAWLVGLGAPHRVGAARHCAHCGYVLLEPPDRLVSICPECSNPWRYFGRARKGERASRPLLFLAGVAAILLAALGGIYHAELKRSVYNSLPTSTLIRHVAIPGFSTDAWDALSARTLARSDHDLLALALLDKRARWRGLDGATERWLDDQLARNLLSPAAKERYFGELVELHLQGPATAIAGERSEYAISAQLHRSDAGTPLGEVYIIIAGYELIPVDPAPPPPRTEPFEGILFPPVPLAGRSEAPLPPEALERSSRPRVSLFPSEPGRYRVRATAYVTVAAARPTISWQTDGAPTLDVPTVTWMPISLEREIEVTKPSP